MSISNRTKEIRRRRKRRANYSDMKAKLAKAATPELKKSFAAKLRKMTPGAEGVIKAWGLE
jgi:hypothetical protein